MNKGAMALKHISTIRYRLLDHQTSLVNSQGIAIPREVIEKKPLQKRYEYQVIFVDGERLNLWVDAYSGLEDVLGSYRLEQLRLLLSLLSATDRVVELGTDSGYSANFLGHFLPMVNSLDWRSEWVRFAVRRYQRPNVKFSLLDIAKWPQGVESFLLTRPDKIVMFNPLSLGLSAILVTEMLKLVLQTLGDLPIFWTERVNKSIGEQEPDWQKMQKEILGGLKTARFAFHQQGADFFAWPDKWSPAYEIDAAQAASKLDLINRVLARAEGPIVFGPGLPIAWHSDFLLNDFSRQYAMLAQPTEPEPSFFPGFIKSVPKVMSAADAEVIVGLDMDVEPQLLLSPKGQGPRAIWRLAQGLDEIQKLRERIRCELLKGKSVEGYRFNNGDGLLIRVDLNSQLPLYPLFDASLQVPPWPQVAAYLDWAKRKSIITVSPESLHHLQADLAGQPHRGMLVLVAFCQQHLEQIKSLAAQGWRIGLGANQAIDQVPLQNFEEFRLEIEKNGVNVETLWMGDRPPDPAYIKNIYSRFSRLLINSAGLLHSWDAKRVRFCLTLKAGDDIQSRLFDAYLQMAGLADHEDYLTHYRWASALEKSGNHQAAKVIFKQLVRSKVAAALNPTRRLAGVHLHLGRIAEAESDLFLAGRHYAQCLDLWPDFIRAAERLNKLSHAKQFA